MIVNILERKWNYGIKMCVKEVWVVFRVYFKGKLEFFLGFWKLWFVVDLGLFNWWECVCFIVGRWVF